MSSAQSAPCRTSTVAVEKFLFSVNSLEVPVVLNPDILGLYPKHSNTNHLGTEFNMLENNNINSRHKAPCNLWGSVSIFFNE